MCSATGFLRIPDKTNEKNYVFLKSNSKARPLAATSLKYGGHFRSERTLFSPPEKFPIRLRIAQADGKAPLQALVNE